jgi:hypothetical protein
MSNSFQDGVFGKVRSMIMIDSYPFENELFKNVSQHSSTLITFPHLEQLDITLAYVDYVEQLDVDDV